MKERTVKIYSCDHCKRKQLRHRGAMAKHESRCVHNIDRKCGFCEFTFQNRGDRLHRRLLKTLVAVLWAYGFDRLCKEAGFCPGCILAAIVQQRIEARETGRMNEIEFIDEERWSFKKAKDLFFEDYNNEQGGYW